MLNSFSVFEIKLDLALGTCSADSVGCLRAVQMTINGFLASVGLERYTEGALYTQERPANLTQTNYNDPRGFF